MTLERAKQLAKQWADGYVCSLREGEAEEYHKLCFSALRAQQEKPFGGWISVEDRLPSLEGLEPDEVEYVLVSEQYFDAITGEKLGRSVSICGFGHDGWSKFDNFGYVRTENITHWMPLPSTEGLK